MQACIPITELHQSDHDCMYISRLTVNCEAKKEQHACVSSGLYVTTTVNVCCLHARRLQMLYLCHHSSYHLDCYSYSIVESLTTLEWNESTQPLLRTS